MCRYRTNNRTLKVRLLLRSQLYKGVVGDAVNVLQTTMAYNTSKDP